MDSQLHRSIINVVSATSTWSRAMDDQQNSSNFKNHSLIIPSVNFKSTQDPHFPRWQEDQMPPLIKHSTPNLNQPTPKYNLTTTNDAHLDQPLDLTCAKKRKTESFEDPDSPLDLSIKKPRLAAIQRESCTNHFHVNFAQTQFQGFATNCSIQTCSKNQSFNDLKPSFQINSTTTLPPSGNFDNPILVDDNILTDNVSTWSTPKFPASKLIQFAHFHNSAITQLTPPHYQFNNSTVSNYPTFATPTIDSEQTVRTGALPIHVNVGLQCGQLNNKLFGYFSQPDRSKVEVNNSLSTGLILQGNSGMVPQPQRFRIGLPSDNLQAKFITANVPSNITQVKRMDSKHLKFHEIGSNLRKLLKKDEPLTNDTEGIIDTNDQVDNNKTQTLIFPSQNQATTSLFIRSLQNASSANYSNAEVSLLDEAKATPIAPFSDRVHQEVNKLPGESSQNPTRSSTLSFAAGSENLFFSNDATCGTSGSRISCKVLGNRSSKKIPVANVQPFMKTGLADANEPIVIDPSPPPPSFTSTLPDATEILHTSSGAAQPFDELSNNAPTITLEQHETVFTNNLADAIETAPASRCTGFLKLANQSRNETLLVTPAPHVNIPAPAIDGSPDTSVSTANTPSSAQDTSVSHTNEAPASSSSKVPSKESNSTKAKKAENQSKKKSSWVSAIEYIDDDTLTQDGGGDEGPGKDSASRSQTDEPAGVSASEVPHSTKQKRNYVRKLTKHEQSVEINPDNYNNDKTSSSSSEDVAKLTKTLATLGKKRKYERRKNGESDDQETIGDSRQEGGESNEADHHDDDIDATNRYQSQSGPSPSTFEECTAEQKGGKKGKIPARSNLCQQSNVDEAIQPSASSSSSSSSSTSSLSPIKQTDNSLSNSTNSNDTAATPATSGINYKCLDRRGRGGKRKTQRKDNYRAAEGCVVHSTSSTFQQKPNAPIFYGFFTSPLRPSNRGRCKKIATPSLHSSNLSSSASTSSSSLSSEVANSFVIGRNLAETRLHQATKLGCEELVWHFLSVEGVHANVQDNQGTTPLHISSYSGHINIARLLLSYGAHPNAKALDGTRPLHNAVLGNHVTLVRLLLTYGADPTLTNFDGKTPIHLAMNTKMRVFLKGVSNDLNSSDEKDLLWGFHDSLNDSANFLSNLPEDGDEELRGVLFDVMSSPPLPTYHVQHGTSSKYKLCHAIADVCRSLGATHKFCAKKLEIIECCPVSSIKTNEMKEATLTQQHDSTKLVPPSKYAVIDKQLKKLMKTDSFIVSNDLAKPPPRPQPGKANGDLRDTTLSEMKPEIKPDPGENDDNNSAGRPCLRSTEEPVDSTLPAEERRESSRELQKKKSKVNKKQDVNVSKLAKICRTTAPLVEKKSGSYLKKQKEEKSTNKSQQYNKSSSFPFKFEAITSKQGALDHLNSPESLLLPVLDKHDDNSATLKEEQEGVCEERKNDEMEMPELTLYS